NRFINFGPTELDEGHSSEDPFQMSNDDELKKLHEAISQLNKQDRIIIGLYLEDMNYEEIAEIVGISMNYVGVKINRIKTVLAGKMEEMK
ncbi:MAG: sigma factor-like helix-turn-helix DNA-binding protein, partial [Ignavibacteriaceae bacterium]